MLGMKRLRMLLTYRKDLDGGMPANVFFLYHHWVYQQFKRG